MGRKERDLQKWHSCCSMNPGRVGRGSASNIDLDERKKSSALSRGDRKRTPKVNPNTHAEANVDVEKTIACVALLTTRSSGSPLRIGCGGGPSGAGSLWRVGGIGGGGATAESRGSGLPVQWASQHCHGMPGRGNELVEAHTVATRRAATKRFDLTMAMWVVFQLGGWRPRGESTISLYLVSVKSGSPALNVDATSNVIPPLRNTRVRDGMQKPGRRIRR